MEKDLDDFEETADFDYANNKNIKTITIEDKEFNPEISIPIYRNAVPILFIINKIN